MFECYIVPFTSKTKEAIKRMRQEKITPRPGFEGEYGQIKVFKEGELARLQGQTDFFTSM